MFPLTQMRPIAVHHLPRYTCGPWPLERVNSWPLMTILKEECLRIAALTLPANRTAHGLNLILAIFKMRDLVVMMLALSQANMVTLNRCQSSASSVERAAAIAMFKRCASDTTIGQAQISQIRVLVKPALPAPFTLRRSSSPDYDAD